MSHHSFYQKIHWQQNHFLRQRQSCGLKQKDSFQACLALYLKEQEVEKILLAESCIEVYEDVEEFLEKSGWRRIIQNCGSECYLFENHNL